MVINRLIKAKAQAQRPMEQKKKTRNRLILSSNFKEINGVRKFFPQMVLEQLYIEKNKLLSPQTYIKSNFRWITNINIKAKILKLVGRNKIST